MRYITRRLWASLAVVLLFPLSLNATNRLEEVGRIRTIQRKVDAQTTRIVREQGTFTSSDFRMFDKTVVAGSDFRFAAAEQLSNIVWTDDRIGIQGTGYATSARLRSAGASEKTFSKSSLFIELVVERVADILLEGMLSVPQQVDLGDLSGLYDRSSGRVVLSELGSGLPLFSHFSDGAFHFNQRLNPGTYTFEIETIAEINALRQYDKSVAWEASLIVQGIPEPSTAALLLSCIVPAMVRRRT